METLKIIISILSLVGAPTLCTLIIKSFYSKMEVRKKTLEEQEELLDFKFKLIELAVQAILRNELLRVYKDCRTNGYADNDERMNFENMYVQYHGLGVNGVMDDIRLRFFALPDSPPSANKEKFNQCREIF